MSVTAKSALFELINSLSTSEKRYIKQFMNQSGETTSNHTKLFEAMAKQEAYDEDKLKKRFKSTSIIKQWSRVKNYLYNYILRVLQNYYQQDVEFELNNNLQQVAILNKKGLYEQAHKLLKKTKFLALEGGLATVLPLIAEWEMILDNLVWYNRESEDLLDYEQNNAWASEVAHNMLVYNCQCIKVFENTVKKGQRNKLTELNEQMLRLPMYASIEDAQSPMAKWFFCVAKVVLHAQIGQYLEAYSNAKSCFNLHQDYPLLQKYAPLTYITSLNNFVQATLDAEQWQELPLLVETIDAYLQKHKTSSKFLYLTCIKYVLLLKTYIKEGNFEVAMDYTKEIEFFLIENERANDRYTKPHILLHHLVHIYIVNGYYQKALEHLEHLERLQQGSVYNNTTFLLKLIVLFEQDEVLLLPYAIRSFYRALLKKKELFDFERLILNLLKHSANAASKRDLSKIFARSLKKMEAFVQRAPKSELELLQHFDYLAWMESKVAQIPLLEVLKNRKEYI